MATKSLITIEQGTDFSLTVNVTGTDGNAFDLTDYTAASTLRKHWSSSTSYSLTAAVTSGSGGEITLTANNTVTSAIPPGRYMYDIEATSNTGSVSRVLQGIATVTPEITR